MGLRQRLPILDFERVLEIPGGVSAADFSKHYEALIQERIARGELKREPPWTSARRGDMPATWRLSLRALPVESVA